MKLSDLKKLAATVNRDFRREYDGKGPDGIELLELRLLCPEGWGEICRHGTSFELLQGMLIVFGALIKPQDEENRQVYGDFWKEESVDTLTITMGDALRVWVGKMCGEIYIPGHIDSGTNDAWRLMDMKGNKNVIDFYWRGLRHLVLGAGGENICFYPKCMRHVYLSDKFDRDLYNRASVVGVQLANIRTRT